MDWMRTINTHTLWKKRLQNLLDGASTETLDPAVIGTDNNCELGQWIYGEGQAYRQEAKFEEVRLMHADYHRLAAEIVSIHQSGYPEAAITLLNGDYARLCERLKHRILGLSIQLKPKES